MQIIIKMYQSTLVLFGGSNFFSKLLSKGKLLWLALTPKTSLTVLILFPAGRLARSYLLFMEQSGGKCAEATVGINILLYVSSLFSS
jgi:hypothetical protein